MIHVVCESVTFEFNGDIGLNGIQQIGTAFAMSDANERKLPRQIVLMSVAHSVLTRRFDAETNAFTYQLEAQDHIVDFKRINTLYPMED